MGFADVFNGRDQQGILFHANHDARFMDDKSLDDESSCGDSASKAQETAAAGRSYTSASEEIILPLMILPTRSRSPVRPAVPE
jgi:hypothetical protein